LAFHVLRLAELNMSRVDGPESQKLATSSVKGTSDWGDASRSYASLVFEAEGGARGRPLLLFLHGRGERGHDTQKVKAHGPPKLFPQHGLSRFSVVAPQCPDNASWDADRLQVFFDDVVARLQPDPRRVYVSGISMGGFGSWELGAALSERLAAVVIVCGGGNGALAKAYRKLPTWLFHSVRDEAVKIAHGDQLFEALRRNDAPVTYTRYPDANHVETWERAYGSPLVFDWLLQHSR
jgi:predicted peptidase